MSSGVCVIVIGYDDVRHVGDAVRSALDQGPDVTEVVAVDDASTDGTAAVLDELAVREPRLRVLHRTANSGGCGTPRNDGLRAAAAPYVMFLDSDDVLPPGAVPALLAAARRHGSQVTAGACVRRELPDGGESRWQRALYIREAVYATPEERPRLVRDTLCVNKLYDREFLRRHDVTFPDGRFRYEDFPFTARVLAAAPRIALIPDTVYVWHVRRRAAGLSLSLDRDVANWRGRLAAHRAAVEVLRAAGADRLAHAAQAKFLDHDLRLYLRELPTHDAPHRRAWWQAARGLLAGYSEQELRAARPPARWLARVVLAAPEPPPDAAELHRLAQLASRPARLLPPYATDAAGRPVWSAALPQAVLDGLGQRPRQGLPVAVDGVWSAGPLGRDTLRLRVHEIYGQLAESNSTYATKARPVRAFVVYGHGWPVCRKCRSEFSATATDGRYAVKRSQHRSGLGNVFIDKRCAMCSIFGIFGLQAGDDLPALRRQALELSQRQRHRGPDWSGVYVDDGAILVHERLAIVDPAGGAQPLRSRDGGAGAGGQRRDLQPPRAEAPTGPALRLPDRLGLRGHQRAVPRQARPGDVRSAASTASSPSRCGIATQQRVPDRARSDRRVPAVLGP